MPTFYTAPIEDKDLTLKEFMQLCTSNFVLGNENLPFGEWPEYAEPSEREMDDLDSALQEMRELLTLTLEEMEIKAKQSYDNEVAYRNKQLERSDKLEKRYNKMLKLIEAWKPPTPEHEGFKDFMLNQIKISLESDTLRDYFTKYPIKKLSGQEWMNQRAESIGEDAKRAIEGQIKEITRTAYRNKWLKELKESI